MKPLASILSLALIFQFSGCDLFKKDDPKPLTELQKLPPATQTGKNTFGCLVNGKAWVPKTTVDVSAVYQQGTLQLGGTLYNPTQFVEMGITEQGSAQITIGDYQLTQTPNNFSNATFETSANTTCTYDPLNTFLGTLTITKIDRTLYIVSGLFNFSTVIQGCDTLKITNGRFDIKYIP